MNWPEDISNDLPARRPDEPPTLRSDILDELHDHLQSSLEHEQITGNNEQSARKSVLSRFGNPSTIACQLWWDAMWGKIMIQRITLGFVALLCAGSIYGLYAIQQTMHASQTLTVGLIEEIRELRAQAQPSPVDERMKYLEWIPVTVKLQYENGEPVTDEGFELRLSGAGLFSSGGNNDMLQRESGNNAEIDFGFVKPGPMTLQVTAPWGEFHQVAFTASPGNPVEKTVTCPRESSQVSVEPSIQWPQEFRDRQLWTHLILRSSGEARTLGQTAWQLDGYIWSLLISPTGEMYGANLQISNNGKKASFSPDSNYCIPVIAWEKIRENEGSQRVFNELQQRRSLLNPLLHTPARISPMNPLDQLTVPAHGVKVISVTILEKRGQQPGNQEEELFRCLLPLTYSKEGNSSSAFGKINYNPALTPEIDLQTGIYEPSDFVVDLVRKRLEQIDELEAEEETKTGSDESP